MKLEINQTYVIEDWACNLKFDGEEFTSFDVAEEKLTKFLRDNFRGYDEWRGEYEIKEVNNV